VPPRPAASDEAGRLRRVLGPHPAPQARVLAHSFVRDALGNASSSTMAGGAGAGLAGARRQPPQRQQQQQRPLPELR
jgi:hypothetical protein